MANPNVNVWEIPPIGGNQIWLDPQKIAKDGNIPLSRVRAIERTLNSKK